MSTVADNASDAAETRVEGPASDSGWLGRREIAAIPGALKPSAYVSRAYLQQLADGGRLPPWARKDPDGHWRFETAYIAADAELNTTTLGITEAARLLGASRRAVQNWVDEGLVASIAPARTASEPRRILRAEFLRELPALRARLAAAAARASAAAHAGDGGAPAPPSSPTLRATLEGRAARDEARLAQQLNRRLEAAERRRRRLADQRRQAEQRLRELEQEEQRAEARAERLKADFSSRLDAADAAARAADQRRAAAARDAARSASLERAADRRTSRLRDTVAAQLAAWRTRSADVIARQLRDAARALGAGGAAAPAAAGAAAATAARRRSAAAVAEQLHEARESRLRADRLQREAHAIAERLADEVAAGRLDRYDAAIAFNARMDACHTPGEIRETLIRRYFSHGT